MLVLKKKKGNKLFSQKMFILLQVCFLLAAVGAKLVGEKKKSLVEITHFNVKVLCTSLQEYQLILLIVEAFNNTFLLPF